MMIRLVNNNLISNNYSLIYKNFNFVNLSIIACVGILSVVLFFKLKGEILGFVISVFISFLITTYVLDRFNYSKNIYVKFLQKLVFFSLIIILSLLIYTLLFTPVIQCMVLEDTSKLVEGDSGADKDQYNFSLPKGAVDKTIHTIGEIFKAGIEQVAPSVGIGTAVGTAAGAAVKASTGLPAGQRAALIGSTALVTALVTKVGVDIGTSISKNLSVNMMIKYSKHSSTDVNSIPSPTSNIIESPLEAGDISPLETLLTDMFILNILLLILFFIFISLIFYRYIFYFNFKFFSDLINRITGDRFKLWFNNNLKKSENFNDKFILFLFIFNTLSLLLILFLNIYVSFELSTNIKDYVRVYNYLNGIS